LVSKSAASDLIVLGEVVAFIVVVGKSSFKKITFSYDVYIKRCV
jgi:hypothetical protein